MTKSLSFASLLLLVLFATTSFAADATGAWKGSSKEGPWAFRLKSEAGTVTGNTYSAEGKELPIKISKADAQQQNGCDTKPCRRRAKAGDQITKERGVAHRFPNEKRAAILLFALLFFWFLVFGLSRLRGPRPVV